MLIVTQLNDKPISIVNICSKCPPFARTQARRRQRHSSIALSMMVWSIRCQTCTKRCLSLHHWQQLLWQEHITVVGSERTVRRGMFRCRISNFTNLFRPNPVRSGSESGYWLSLYWYSPSYGSRDAAWPTCIYRSTTLCITSVSYTHLTLPTIYSV